MQWIKNPSLNVEPGWTSGCDVQPSLNSNKKHLKIGRTGPEIGKSSSSNHSFSGAYSYYPVILRILVFLAIHFVGKYIIPGDLTSLPHYQRVFFGLCTVWPVIRGGQLNQRRGYQLTK